MTKSEQSQIPDGIIDATVRVLDTAIRRALEDEKNRLAFEAWKAEQAKKKGEQKCTK